MTRRREERDGVGCRGTWQRRTVQGQSKTAVLQERRETGRLRIAGLACHWRLHKSCAHDGVAVDVQGTIVAKLEENHALHWLGVGSQRSRGPRHRRRGDARLLSSGWLCQAASKRRRRSCSRGLAHSRPTPAFCKRRSHEYRPAHTFMYFRSASEGTASGKSDGERECSCCVGASRHAGTYGAPRPPPWAPVPHESSR